LPGDTLEIRNRDLFIDGNRVEHPSTVQFFYNVNFSGAPNQRNWANWGIAEDDVHVNGSTYSMFLNSEQIDLLKKDDPELQIEHMNFDRPQFTGKKMYPHNARYNGQWSNDNYGPIWIPKAGSTITLTPQNFDLYFRAIKVYEGNTIERRDNQFVINGKVTSTYTFKQDYYWLMGDNRHNSEDSRVWGFVPMDHVVGKPLFIWFSLRENSFAKGINWSRIFTSAAEN